MQDTPFHPNVESTQVGSQKSIQDTPFHPNVESTRVGAQQFNQDTPTVQNEKDGDCTNDGSYADDIINRFDKLTRKTGSMGSGNDQEKLVDVTEQKSPSSPAAVRDSDNEQNVTEQKSPSSPAVTPQLEASPKSSSRKRYAFSQNFYFIKKKY